MITTLADALPRAEFLEHHHRVVRADPELVWSALQETRWRDCRATAVLSFVRGLSRPSGSHRRLLDDGPVVVLHSEAGRYVAGGRVARPWRMRPEMGPAVRDLDELAAFDQGAWLKYGMDFRLSALGDGRTLLETTTRCQPTDATVRRRFGAYWRLIRPFSGLVRRDMLGAIARRAEASAAR
jgi:hypothetical protein